MEARCKQIKMPLQLSFSMLCILKVVLAQCLEDVKVQLSKPRTEADRLIEELVPELSTPLTGLGLRTSQQGAARLDELGPAEREKILQYLISKLRALAVASSSPPRQAADNRTTSLPPIFAERHALHCMALWHPGVAGGWSLHT